MHFSTNHGRTTLHPNSSPSCFQSLYIVYELRLQPTSDIPHRITRSVTYRLRRVGMGESVKRVFRSPTSPGDILCAFRRNRISVLSGREICLGAPIAKLGIYLMFDDAAKPPAKIDENKKFAGIKRCTADERGNVVGLRMYLTSARLTGRFPKVDFAQFMVFVLTNEYPGLDCGSCSLHSRNHSHFLVYIA